MNIKIERIKMIYRNRKLTRQKDQLKKQVKETKECVAKLEEKFS